jgi:DNA-binding transcriptional regulator YdaS (Cro superfamily)
MNLREYLFKNHLSAAEMSRQLGINGNYFRMVVRGIARPGFELCLKIEMFTGGQVKLADLRDDKKYPEMLSSTSISSNTPGDRHIDDQKKNIATND